jgi:hypothetical protein
VPDLRLIPDVRKSKDPRPISDKERRVDNYQSLLRQYVATDQLISELVAKMKASNNWDNTLIIVTADHGMTFVPGETYRDKINPLNRGTLEDIYRIPLFIKYPDQKLASVSDCDVSSIDLLATVIDVTRVEPNWKTQGTSLYNSCPERKSRTLRWPGGETELDTSFSALQGRVRYYNEWINADGDVDEIYRSGLSGSQVGMTVPQQQIKSNGVFWDLIKPESYQNFGSKEFSHIIGRASGKLFTTRKLCQKCEGLIAVNGKFVGVVSELAGMEVSKAGKYFSSSLMTRLMESGPAEVELWISDWSSEEAVLSRVGPPQNRLVPSK